MKPKPNWEVIVLDAGVEHGRLVLERHVAEAARRSLVVLGIAVRGLERVAQPPAVAGDVGGDLLLIVGAARAQRKPASQVLAAARRRRLGQHVEHAADGAAAVEHRRRAAHHLDGLGLLGVDQAGDLAEVCLAARVVE
jgi:hypothetical protein